MRYLFQIILLAVIVLFKDGHEESFEECWINTYGTSNSVHVHCGSDAAWGGALGYKKEKKIPLFDIENIIE